jgi:hypothetical protein
MILVKFKADCNDEFNVHGFRVFTDAEFMEWHLEMLKDIEVFKNTEFYVGTNDLLVYKTWAELLRDVKVVNLEETEAAALLKLFPSSSFGWFPEPHEI